MKIGLTYTGSEEKHDNYVRWLQDNPNVEVVKLSVAEDNLAEVKNCDGIVLSGGVDIHPKYYGEKKLDYPNSQKFQEERDEFEIAVFNSAQKNKIPVLGICRGFQLINCIMGGTLKQDLGKDLNQIHRSEMMENRQIDKAHGLNIYPETILSEITDSDRGVVNSAHHQSIDRLGKDLRINCMSDDGTIEGFERENNLHDGFLLGIQWHPERMFKFQLQDSPLSKKIRERFIEAVSKHD